MGKFCDFRPKSPFILETVQDRSMVTIALLTGSHIAHRSVLVPKILIDLKRREAMDHFFPADLRNYVHNLSPVERTNSAR